MPMIPGRHSAFLEGRIGDDEYKGKYEEIDKPAPELSFDPTKPPKGPTWSDVFTLWRETREPKGPKL